MTRIGNIWARSEMCLFQASALMHHTLTKVTKHVEKKTKKPPGKGLGEEGLAGSNCRRTCATTHMCIRDSMPLKGML